MAARRTAEMEGAQIGGSERSGEQVEGTMRSAPSSKMV